MIIDILGLGESLEFHTGDNITFGVNDICRVKNVDYLVCVDHKTAFNPERLNVIEQSDPIIFYSHLPEWRTHQRFELIKLQQFYPGKIANLDIQELPKSVFSPYVAVGLAWQKFAPEKIRLFGVDMDKHRQLKNSKPQIQKHWQAMVTALNQKGCRVEVFGTGLLQNTISS